MDRIAKGFTDDEIKAIADWYGAQRIEQQPWPPAAVMSSRPPRPRRPPLPLPALAQASPARVVVVGGGFAGATCARTVKRLDPRTAVTLVEASQTFTACPFSNEVIAGLRDIKAQQFDYKQIAAEGIVTAFDTATAVDPQARMVTLANGGRLPYDRLVLAPGIDFRWDALAGLRRSRSAAHAACLEGGRADAVAAAPARSHAGRRPRRSSRRRPIRSAARPDPTSGRA